MHHQGLSYVREIIRIELTSRFRIEKTQQLVARKSEIAYAYHWKDTSYDAILIVVDRLAQISRCTRAGGDNFRRCN